MIPRTSSRRTPALKEQTVTDNYSSTAAAMHRTDRCDTVGSGNQSHYSPPPDELSDSRMISPRPLRLLARRISLSRRYSSVLSRRESIRKFFVIADAQVRRSASLGLSLE